MYCLLQVHSPTMQTPVWIEKDQYHKILQTLCDSGDLLDAVELFSFYTEAYEELKDWCAHTDTYGENLMSNMHTAERKCRGLLLELKTYFLQMKSKLERKYGSDSAIYKMFMDAEENAKQTNAVFAFAMDLKECANHCNSIVHSFIVSDDRLHLTPCCIPSKLLSDYDSWSRKGRRYLSSVSGNTDFLELFESIYEVLKGIQKQLVNHLLVTNQLKDGLLDLRSFMDDHFTKENCCHFQLAHMVYRNKKDAPKWAFFQKKVAVEFDAYLKNWNAIYELTDLIRESEGAK